MLVQLVRFVMAAPQADQPLEAHFEGEGNVRIAATCLSMNIGSRLITIEIAHNERTFVNEYKISNNQVCRQFVRRGFFRLAPGASRSAQLSRLVAGFTEAVRGDSGGLVHTLAE